jgi:DNA-binding response OmpR family regulator
VYAGSGRILVVEDEPDVAELLRYHLAKEGYDVVVAPNGSDAVKRARDVRPELILLDIMVPQLNGWEVCRRLKADPETRAISIIMVTGRVEEGDKVPSRRPAREEGPHPRRGPGKRPASLRDSHEGPRGRRHPEGIRAARGARRHAPSSAPPIETVRGVGYRLRDAG